MNFPILYCKTSKGDVQQWSIWTEENRVCTEYGKLDGAMQYSEFDCFGKNIGKANETTDEEQADLEASALWQKKKDKKYFESIEELEAILIRPMLAKVYQDEKDKVEFPCFVQPKLNGVRCLAYLDNGKVILISRTGKQYYIPHIRDAAKSFLLKNPTSILDGEIYIHGKTLQDITSLVKKENLTEQEMYKYKKDLEYWVYDIADKSGDTYTFGKRFYEDTIYFDEVTLVKVNTKLVKSEKEIEDFMDKCLFEKYEGIIIRNMFGRYKLGHRSSDLLKYKKWQDDEFEIIGFKEGKGKFKGACIWMCKTKDNKEFECTPEGTMEQRREWFQNGNKYIGKLLTVKFIEYTPDGIPFHLTGLGIRDYE